MIIIPLSHELPLWWRTLIAACRTLESFHPCSSFGDRYVVLKRRHVFCCNTDSNPAPVRVEPVSVSTRKSCRENVAEARDCGGIFGDTSRLRATETALSASAVAKPRKIKAYSDSRTKAALCKTAWWRMQSSSNPSFREIPVLARKTGNFQRKYPFRNKRSRKCDRYLNCLRANSRQTVNGKNRSLIGNSRAPDGNSHGS